MTVNDLVGVLCLDFVDENAKIVNERGTEIHNVYYDVEKNEITISNPGVAGDCIWDDAVLSEEYPNDDS